VAATGQAQHEACAASATAPVTADRPLIQPASTKFSDHKLTAFQQKVSHLTSIFWISSVMAIATYSMFVNWCEPA
jgi:hypothetical protein